MISAFVTSSEAEAADVKAVVDAYMGQDWCGVMPHLDNFEANSGDQSLWRWAVYEVDAATRDAVASSIPSGVYWALCGEDAPAPGEQPTIPPGEPDPRRFV